MGTYCHARPDRASRKKFIKYERNGYVYIMASGKNGTLYVGTTSNLLNRNNQHKKGTLNGFTEKYNVKRLVYYEVYDNMELAIQREKQIKKWNREWKIKLIEKDNPNWEDLSKHL